MRMLVLATLLITACFRDERDLAPFPCGADGTCPSGLTCTQGVGCAVDCALFDPDISKPDFTDESCQLALDLGGAIVSVYLPTQISSEGEPCTSATACYDGETCNVGTTPLVCRDLCDDAHSCPASMQCTPRGNLPMHGGVCL